VFVLGFFNDTTDIQSGASGSQKKENTPWLEQYSTVENRHTGTYKQETYTQNKIQLNWFTLELTLLE